MGEVGMCTVWRAVLNLVSKCLSPQELVDMKCISWKHQLRSCYFQGKQVVCSSGAMGGCLCRHLWQGTV